MAPDEKPRSPRYVKSTGMPMLYFRESLVPDGQLN